MSTETAQSYTLSLPIFTERLQLRLFAEDDVDAMFAYHGLPEVARYTYRPPRTRERCTEVIANASTPTGWDEDGQMVSLAICPRDGGEPFGDVMLRLADARARQMEIGWVLHPSREGKGYATEAARAAAVAAFDQLDAHRLFARVDVENAASVRLCERLGMRREAHFIENDRHPDGRWGSEYVYAALRADLRR